MSHSRVYFDYFGSELGDFWEGIEDKCPNERKWDRHFLLLLRSRNMDSKNGETTPEEQTPKELEGLTYLQRRALVCIMTGMTSAEAAIECNVSKKTLDRIRGSKVFKETLSQAGTEIYLNALAELTLSVKKAVKRINGVLDDENAPHRAHLTAADLVLKHVDKIMNFETYDRIQAIEKMLEEHKNAPPTITRYIRLDADGNETEIPVW